MRNVLHRAAFGIIGTGMIVTMAAGATTAASAAAAAPHSTATESVTPSCKSLTLSWPAVRKTAQGNRVLTIQYLLNDHGYPVSLTKYFGDDTEKQVIAFQTKNNLNPNGIVGDKTWEKLVVDLGPGTTHKYAVDAVQSYLKNAYGYKDLTVNGNYDAKTEAAVKKFQGDRKPPLPATGKVNLDTWHALVSDAL
jgi:peptidoglycan hydrolase-like protein with peptidoglycan-binding domain